MSENEDLFSRKPKEERRLGEPTGAFKGAAWGSLQIGVAAYLIGLYNALMELNEKGYYITLLIIGLYAAVSLQKAVRDRDEGIRVTNLYFGIGAYGDRPVQRRQHHFERERLLQHLVRLELVRCSYCAEVYERVSY